jgi:hypothetical protein
MATIEEQIKARFPPKTSRTTCQDGAEEAATSSCTARCYRAPVAQDRTAILAEVHRQGDLLKEHEARLDRHSELIYELRFKEEPEPTKTQAAQATILRALLAANSDKMLAKDAEQKRGLLTLRSLRLALKLTNFIAHLNSNS